MASRNYLKHTVSDTQPSDAALGDEWYQPASNILYKCVATNGTSVIFVPVATAPNNNLSVTGSIQGTQVIASNGLVVNNMNISANYTIPPGYSASSVGPITINNGITVTVPSGSRWVIQ